jgi:hypothetical protein
MEETVLTADQRKKQQEEKRIMKEMMPYFLYALIPLAITITICWTCAPRMTLP